MSRLDEASKRVETLLERFSAFPATTGVRADAEELIHTVSGLYGECLDRIAQTLLATLGKEEADALLERCCNDPLVASLLITHGLHPVPLRVRVERAIESVRPYLDSHDAHVELVSVDEDTVELQISGAADLIPKVEAAIREAAPEVLNMRESGQTISLLEVR